MTPHWLCSIGQTVAPDYFCPPVSPKGEAVLRVTAFHVTLPRCGVAFARTVLGELWVRTA